MWINEKDSYEMPFENNGQWRTSAAPTASAARPTTNNWLERYHAAGAAGLVDLSGDGSDIRRLRWIYNDGLPKKRHNVSVFNDRNELILSMAFTPPDGGASSSGVWNFDLSEMVPCEPDLNNDGVVDHHDLQVVLANFHTACD